MPESLDDRNRAEVIAGMLEKMAVRAICKPLARYHGGITPVERILFRPPLSPSLHPKPRNPAFGAPHPDANR